MARRIKEEPIVHQTRIAKEAEKLFLEKGIQNTSMNEVALKSGYSKATLYVYFKNKEEIIAFLGYRSMKSLKETIQEALESQEKMKLDSKETFLKLCFALADYQTKYPEYFERSLESLDFDKNADAQSIAGLNYIVGEEINELIRQFIVKGIERKEIKREMDSYILIFQIWGMISGLIKLSSSKSVYLETSMNVTREQFLQDGFERIFEMLKKQ